MTDKQSMDTFVSLCKRRGFVFPSSEIYGGLGGFWDYGPLGVELKSNIKRSWWRNTVQERADVVGIETSIIMNPRVWEASGHVKTFADPMVDCKDCQHRFRTDDVEPNDKGEIRCPDCGGPFTDSRMFNLMFKTFIGPVADDASVAYLRPETAQGMFVNFDNVVTTMRKKLPFGIAQIGRSFRNEITPGNFIFRDREFEQMEMEFFVMPGTDEEWHDRWIETRMSWWTDDLGVRKENLKLREHPKEELSHYSKRTVDIEYDFPFAGFAEIEGIANRTDFDLKQHEEHAGKSLRYFDEPSGENIIPYVIEPAMGVDRCFLTILIDSYVEEEVKDEKRTVLRLKPHLAPIKVAVLPLSRNEKLVPTAQRVHELLRPLFMTQFDDAQSIGRRYRRQDEIGTPYCVTVDFDTLDDDAVTIRDRDTMAQDRVTIANLPDVLRQKLPAV
ncbi:MAG: glycine--tRNA ligase [Chloroflexi bacterium]|nr:glycine--tRNA ligase [Chloroflexota bacterium]MCI0815252.1 glycine--tRNA ligase [Chloroflexota bacterium]MCI0820621.1 glycine--tRNA ligase [Chloroflexota bacterium]